MLARPPPLSVSCLPHPAAPSASPEGVYLSPAIHVQLHTSAGTGATTAAPFSVQLHVIRTPPGTLGRSPGGRPAARTSSRGSAAPLSACVRTHSFRLLRRGPRPRRVWRAAAHKRSACAGTRFVPCAYAVAHIPRMRPDTFRTSPCVPPHTFLRAAAHLSRRLARPNSLAPRAFRGCLPSA
jgi:hypothetical protein